MKNAGWIKLYRSYKNWKYYNKIKYRIVWEEMLLSASYQKSIKNNVVINEGDLIFSYRSWEKKFENFDMKINIRSLRTIISNLEKEKQIEVKKYIKENLTIISIKNYQEYQQKHDKCKAESDTPFSTPAPQKVTHLRDKTVTPSSTPNDTPLNNDSFNASADVNQLSFLPDSDEGQALSTPNDRKRHTIDGKTTRKTTLLKEEKKIKENKEKRKDNTKASKKEANIKKDKFLNEISRPIIKHLSDTKGNKNGKTFSADDPSTIRLLKALIARNYAVKDIMNVITYLEKEWRFKTYPDGKKAMRYFRPETIFNLTKFESYYCDMSYNMVNPDDDADARIRRAIEDEKEKEDQEIKKRYELNKKEVEEIINLEAKGINNIIGEGKFQGDLF